MRKKDPAKEEAILNAAVQEFAVQGFHATKMSSIAERAGVAAGSVYLYFENKESIILRIIDQIWKRLFDDYEEIWKRTDFSAIEKIDALIDLIFDLFSGNPEQAIIFVNEQHHLMQTGFEILKQQENKFIDLCQLVVVEGVEKGLFNPNTDITIFKDFVFGGLRHLLSIWAHDPEKYHLTKMREETKQLIKKGILSN